MSSPANSPKPISHPVLTTAPRPTGHNIDGIAPTAHRLKQTQASRIFDQAVTTATSHTQQSPKESKRYKTSRFGHRHVKLISLSATTLAILILGGFIAYQNKANLELQLASTKAGFHATMPSYKPIGFAFKSLNYQPGSVMIGYNSGSKTLNVSQKQSNWDSTTLLQNFVATSGDSYQAYEAAGRTIYVYTNGAQHGLTAVYGIK